MIFVVCSKHRSAFTLTALMVMVVVMGVLAAVAIPIYRFSPEYSLSF